MRDEDKAMTQSPLILLGFLFLSSPVVATAAQEKEVPVTIKELDLDDAIREFQGFRQELQSYQKEISGSRKIAQETAKILEDLRRSASAENGFNEQAILQAIQGYLDEVVGKQIGLVDYLESQRYRISYYAGQMAAAVRPQELAMLFGTPEQNLSAIQMRTRSLSDIRDQIRKYVDGLPPGQFDRATFHPLPSMPADQKRELNQLLYRYQQERDALGLAKKRLQLVSQSNRALRGGPDLPEVDTDLLMGQMFGALGRIRLQMSIDLMNLEGLLDGYAQSTRTQEILKAFEDLVQMQGDIEGPSPELAGILDWLQESSMRKISLAAEGLNAPGLSVDRSSDLLREAYGSSRDPQH